MSQESVRHHLTSPPWNPRTEHSKNEGCGAGDQGLLEERWVKVNTLGTSISGIKME